MKIFIIGPEGAGKTIFATMLKEYVGQHPETGLAFRSADIKTMEYLTDQFGELNKGEWPDPTKEGKLVDLNWKLEVRGKVSDINLIDSAGQDIRQALCKESVTLKIVDKIEQADLLILLVDLFGHQKENKEKRIQNGWIIQKVLSLLTPKQNVIFAVTKADMLTGTLPRDQWGDRTSILKLVADMMPEFELSGYRSILDSPNCSVLAFSSVATTENRTQGGRLLRFPKSPLASEGMDMVVQAVLTACEEKDKRDKKAAAAKIKADLEKKRAEDLTRLAMIAACIAAAIVVVFLISGLLSSLGTGTRSCDDCKGTGIIHYSVTCTKCEGSGTSWWGIRKCSPCNGTGSFGFDRSCPKCLGKGSVPK